MWWILNCLDTLKSNLSLAITDAEVDGNRPWDDNIITSLLLNRRSAWICKKSVLLFSE